jgi:hypothetical protein
MLHLAGELLRLRGVWAQLRRRSEPPGPEAHDGGVRSLPAIAARYRRMLADLPGTMKRDPDRARGLWLRSWGRSGLLPKGKRFTPSLKAEPTACYSRSAPRF